MMIEETSMRNCDGESESRAPSRPFWLIKSKAKSNALLGFSTLRNWNAASPYPSHPRDS